jgi:hypothetical protein
MPRGSGARGVILLAGVFVGIALAGASPASSARTLFYWPRPISAFAQDANYVAWTEKPSFTRCGRVYIRSLANGRQRGFGSDPLKACFGGFASSRNELALGRGRALWVGTVTICGNCNPERVFTASLADPVVSGLGTFVFLDGGRQLTGLAADAGLLAFSWVRYEEIAPFCFCNWDVTGGRTAQVLQRDRRFVPGVPPAALMAAGAGRIAVAPSDDPWGGPEDPQPAENGPVKVLDPRTGAPVMSVSPTGTVRALALSATALAVLVKHTGGGLAIERYAIPAATLITSTPVSARASSQVLDISGRWIVYRVGRYIRIVDDLGDNRLLAIALGIPIGVSIEGRRVAWAENALGRHRFRAAFVPG